MRILLIRHGSLGDVVNTTPVARRLRAENPDAEIFVEVLPAHAQAYFRNPHIDAITAPGLDLKGFDKVINLNGAYERDRRRHQVDAFMLAAFGDAEGDKSVYVSHAKWLGDPRFDFDRAVTLHPNVSWESRTLPAKWWQQVAELIVENGWQVIVTGTGLDHVLGGHDILDTRGQLSLSGQVSLIESSRVALFGPAGMATIAGATDTPLVIICNITREEWGIPYRHGVLGWNAHGIKTPMPCYGCSEHEPEAEYYPCRRGDNACLETFDPKEVSAAVCRAIENDLRRGLC